MTDTEPVPAAVLFDGVLSIRTIVPARATLLEALAGAAPVLVDCSAAESVDLSFIQLLLAARLSARQAGKSLRLTGPACGALAAALAQGGFLPPSGADPFWSGDA
ncbi:MAG: STAS domain-containing protein [Acetobacteraceae bacterium]